jgi:hypothetical protein
MTELFYKQYITAREKRDLVDSKIKLLREEFETKLAPFKVLLNEFDSETDKSSELLIKWMEGNDIKTGEYENKTITRSMRSTPKITDTAKFIESIFDKKVLPSVKKLTSKSKEELESQLIKVEIADKKAAIGLAAMLEGVEGIKIKGYEVEQTTYLTVK